METDTQILIVEGNDAFAIAALLQKHKISNPVGYESDDKVRKFFKSSGSVEKALKSLKDALDLSGLTNIGLVVDADYTTGKAGYAKRWQQIRKVLASTFSEEALQAADQQTGAKILKQDGLTVGIWVMPDNQNEGYLEHFLAELIPPGNALWQFTEQTITDLQTKPFNELNPNRLGKAKLHTWLAWKEEPGKPFGLALKAGYIPPTGGQVDRFLDWFKQTFQLSIV